MAEHENRPRQDIGQDEAWAAKLDRTYEDYGALLLNAHKQAAQELAQVNGITTQALQNAVETANMVSKQAVRHSDIAIDRQWNVDEQSWAVEAIVQAVTRSQAFKEAIKKK